MTSDHDKLLAQGPRTAPEPTTAGGFAAPAPVEQASFELPAVDGFAPAPAERSSDDATASKPPLLKAPPQGSWSRSSGSSWLTGPLLRRLIPLLLVLVVVGRGLAGGHSGSWVFALVWVVAAVAIIALRIRGRRPW